MKKQPAIYILTNKKNGTLYIGVTSNLASRIDTHRRLDTPSFTKKYRLHVLVHIEYFETMEQAIAREKQLKAGSRKKKIDIIECHNPHWEDIGHLI
jgi:putative endonuclease